MSVKFTDNSAKFFNDLDSGIVIGMKRGATLLATNIKKNTPTVTGNLKASIQPTDIVNKTATGFNTTVSTPVVYAPSVEFGGGARKLKSGKTIIVNFTPRAMFRKGGDQSVQGVENEIKRALPE